MKRENDMGGSSFVLALLRWFSKNGRSMPWCETTDPYAIWISEVILQQTRIQQGWAYWERFMACFPKVEDLAAASEDEMLRLWQGLDHYSRTRNLHHVAKQVVELGHFPNTVEGLKILKGVGDYTAAAIGSIAFGLPVAVADGNVYRVLACHYGIYTPINTTEGEKEFAALTQSLLPAIEPSAYNQTIMDFGAIQCTPISPRYLVCPLTDSCMALRAGKVDGLPIKLKTLKVKMRKLVYVHVRRQGKTAIHRQTAGDIWQGLWEPLLYENEELPDFPGQLSLLKKGVKHVLTHRILQADLYLLRASEKLTLPDDYIQVEKSELDQYALPRLIELLLESLPENDM